MGCKRFGGEGIPMSDLEKGDTIDAAVAQNEYELEDWGKVIDGEYTYAMMDNESGGEYYVAISEYEVKKVNGNE